jgi:hypothetical protein
MDLCPADPARPVYVPIEEPARTSRLSEFGVWWVDYRVRPGRAAQVAYVESRRPCQFIEYMRVMPDMEIAKLHRPLHCQQATIRQIKKLLTLDFDG